MELTPTRFLGRTCTVDQSFKLILGKVEDELRHVYSTEMAALPVGTPQPTWDQWHGVRGVGGYRPKGGWHAKGKAIDLNYARNGYSATLTQTSRGPVYGGEAAGGDFRGVRRAFIEAVSRACAQAGVPCDLSARGPGEATGAVWDRWHLASEAVRAYLAPWYPSVDDYDAGEDDILPGVTLASIPVQVRVDYWALRVPLVVGAPSLHPRLTRNPAKGLMDLQRAVVVALCDVGGLRWGACDFGAGGSENGDIQHFDMGHRVR